MTDVLSARRRCSYSVTLVIVHRIFQVHDLPCTGPGRDQVHGELLCILPPQMFFVQAIKLPYRRSSLVYRQHGGHRICQRGETGRAYGVEAEATEPRKDVHDSRLTLLAALHSARTAKAAQSFGPPIVTKSGLSSKCRCAVRTAQLRSAVRCERHIEVCKTGFANDGKAGALSAISMYHVPLPHKTRNRLARPRHSASCCVLRAASIATARWHRGDSWVCSSNAQQLSR